MRSLLWFVAGVVSPIVVVVIFYQGYEAYLKIKWMREARKVRREWRASSRKQGGSR